MTPFRKLMGSLKAVLGIIWVGVFILGWIYGLRGIEWAADRSEIALTVLVTNLKDVNSLLGELTQVVEKVDQSIGTIESSTIDASIAVGDTRPIFDKSAQVITDEVPLALDEVQASMPSVIEAAASIDDTLRLLSKFKFSVPIPFGNSYDIGLGINYDPEVPLELALENLSGNLAGIPESMRAMEKDLATADENLVVMGDDLLNMAYDLDLIRVQMADINPQVETIITNLAEVQISIWEIQNRIPGVATKTQQIFIALMMLLIISQIPSIYIGYLVVKGEYPPNGNQGKNQT
jgi:hypothetical protein